MARFTFKLPDIGEGIAEADTLLLTVPNQLGVDFNLKMLEAIVKEIKPALTTK